MRGGVAALATYFPFHIYRNCRLMTNVDIVLLEVPLEITGLCISVAQIQLIMGGF